MRPGEQMQHKGRHKQSKVGRVAWCWVWGCPDMSCIAISVWFLKAVDHFFMSTLSLTTICMQFSKTHTNTLDSSLVDKETRLVAHTCVHLCTPAAKTDRHTETETAGNVNLLKLNPLQLCVTSFIGVKTQVCALSLYTCACVCVCGVCTVCGLLPRFERTLN